ncbi:MAG: hypothetical protein DRR19_10715 [Candidatus Parabeggiatoa sp. nov. 1]|nr:MAG: hypothetical protein DRR19_10715 [Gammaproteobacteria bacterium]
MRKTAEEYQEYKANLVRKTSSLVNRLLPKFFTSLNLIMNFMATTPNTYDELPYYCTASPRAQPNRLATVATLFGMNPPPVPTSRVLLSHNG